MRIKTWRQRCEEHPDHDGIVSEGMIQARMQEEIDELRAALNAEREACIDLVAMYGGPVDLEAAIRARGEK